MVHFLGTMKSSFPMLSTNYQALTLHEWEIMYGISRGNIPQSAMPLNQLFPMRPLHGWVGAIANQFADGNNVAHLPFPALVRSMSLANTQP